MKYVSVKFFLCVFFFKFTEFWHYNVAASEG